MTTTDTTTTSPGPQDVREAAKGIVETLRQWKNDGSGAFYLTHTEAIDYVAARIAAPSPDAQDVQPVGWQRRYRFKQGPDMAEWSWSPWIGCDEATAKAFSNDPASEVRTTPPSLPEGAREALDELDQDGRGMPGTVTVCGSTRYLEQHLLASGYLTLHERKVVFLCSMLRMPEVTAEQSESFDLVHKEKIRRSDEILVLDDHMGESTRSEIEFARGLGKNIRYLSHEPAMAEWIRSNTIPRPDASAGLIEAAEHLTASANQIKGQADKLRAVGTDECNEQAGELEIIEPCLRAEANYLRARAAADRSAT